MMEIVAEVGPCNGSVKDALMYVDACGELDITMKVQWYDRDRLTSRSAPRYDQTDGRTITQHTMFEKVLNWDDWKTVFDYAEKTGVSIFPSVFDLESIMVAEAMGVKRLKIASADITYHELISSASRVADELIISTGGATEEEVIDAMQVALKMNNNPPMMLACHLAYPSRINDARVGRMVWLRSMFGGKAGYSDHINGQNIEHLPLLVANDCKMWERHFTLTPGHGGDHNMAITREGMTKAIGVIRRTMELMGEEMLRPTQAEQDAIKYARRSLHAATDIPKGTRITRDMLKVVRPGVGIPPFEIATVLDKGGMFAMVDIAEDEILTWPMVGHAGATLDVE